MNKEPDYRFRPFKATERYMLCDAFKRIQLHRSLSEYTYLGFGALHYVDFKLFYKHLGIPKMVSVEQRKKIESRFTFNSPYGFIDLRFGDSFEVLPLLNLKRPMVAWLDYTQRLLGYQLEDVATIIGKVEPYSMLLVSLNHYSRSYFDGDDSLPTPSGIKKKMVDELGPSHFTLFPASKFTTNGLPDIYRHVLLSEIEKTLKGRNAQGGEPLVFLELFCLKYNDGAPMITYGGILCPESKKDDVRESFAGLEYVATEHYYTIKYPTLTLKEQATLVFDRSLIDKLKCFQGEELDRYLDLYRYIPSYAEAIL